VSAAFRWGGGDRTSTAFRYLRRIPDDLCAEIVTYPKGYAGFKHRDMLRLAHPNPAKSCAFATKKATKMTYAYIIFCYACTGEQPSSILYPDTGRMDSIGSFRQNRPLQPLRRVVVSLESPNVC
jgi:hypothetical protein